MSTKRKAADSLKTPDSKRPTSITSFFAPKNPPSASKNQSASSNEAPSNKFSFDKEAWAKKLTPEQRELLQLELDTLHESWFGALKEELVTPRFLELKRFLKKEKEAGKTVFPPENDIYSW